MAFQLGASRDQSGDPLLGLRLGHLEDTSKPCDLVFGITGFVMLANEAPEHGSRQ